MMRKLRIASVEAYVNETYTFFAPILYYKQDIPRRFKEWIVKGHFNDFIILTPQLNLELFYAHPLLLVVFLSIQDTEVCWYSTAELLISCSYAEGCSSV